MPCAYEPEAIFPREYSVYLKSPSPTQGLQSYGTKVAVGGGKVISALFLFLPRFFDTLFLLVSPPKEVNPRRAAIDSSLIVTT